MVVDKCVGRCLDVGSTPTGSIFKNGRCSKRLKGLCWKRSRRVKTCVGSESLLRNIYKRPWRFVKVGIFALIWWLNLKLDSLFRLFSYA